MLCNILAPAHALMLPLIRRLDSVVVFALFPVDVINNYYCMPEQGLHLWFLA